MYYPSCTIAPVRRSCCPSASMRIEAAPSHPTFEPLLWCTHSLYCLLPSK